MRDSSPPPSIAVTIRWHLRVYYAYVTTDGPELDGPTTMTLFASTLMELFGFALDPITRQHTRQDARAARPDRPERTRLASRQIIDRSSASVPKADSMLASLQTFQHWLWQRLQASNASQGTRMNSASTRPRQPLAIQTSFPGGHRAASLT
jgi:hypothetical protein